VKHPTANFVRHLFIITTLSAISFWSDAQVVQWASHVQEFSSELTPIQYAAKQILGKPNVLPSGGQSPNAWSPDMPKRKEFVKLGYANPIQIRQIAIAESHNPSALSRVLAYDEKGKEYVIHTLNPMVVPLKGRMLNIFMDYTPYKVAALKLEFDGTALPDYFGIDAVAISDSNYPIIADIPTMQLLAAGILIETLDKNVNSDYKELNPVLSPDGKVLYFSRGNHPENTGGAQDKEDIWYSELDSEGKWQLAKNLGSQFNNSDANSLNSIQAITPDGKSAVMLLSSNDGKTGGVSISSNISGEWSKPVPLKIRNDEPSGGKANYYLTNNRLVLLMAIQRKDSYGDRDLYVSFMQPDSIWTEPNNLGNILNTGAEESAPFLDVDNKTLYFSSKGFSGYGGSDIYVTKRLDDTWTNWSDPENLGPGINSPLEDLFFNIPISGDYAYYSRGLSETNTDIFRVKLPILKTAQPWVTITGKVSDQINYKPMAAKVTFQQIPGGHETGIIYSHEETGFYEIQLAAGKEYQLKVESEGYKSELKKVDLKNIQPNRVLKNYDFVLQSLKPASKLVFQPVLFENNRTTITAASITELNRLVTILKTQPTLEIEIRGHSDSAGTEEHNMKLSEQRTEAVSSFLLKKGIASSRIHKQSFGSSKPSESNDTEEGRNKNRRVELKIINKNI
jgi:OmpA-OmpF porin, OOP family